MNNHLMLASLQIVSATQIKPVTDHYRDDEPMREVGLELNVRSFLSLIAILFSVL